MPFMNIIRKLTELETDAANFGFKWENPEQIMAQIESECSEIREHLNQTDQCDKLQEEIGDLMHAVFSLCVFCQFDPEKTLEQSVDKFERRLNEVKTIAKEQGISNLTGYSFDELMNFWHQAKKRTD